MAATKPIKDRKKINELKEYFWKKKELRNYSLVILGMNTALRISDLLLLKWESVYDFKFKKYYIHLELTEKKTQKKTSIFMNKEVCISLEFLRQQYFPQPDEFIFKSRTGSNKPISRNRAYCILKQAAQEIQLGNNFSCHSLRKTFGYHAWKRGFQPAIIMDIYNHSSYEVTKHYLSIDQDDKDAIFRDIRF